MKLMMIGASRTSGTTTLNLVVAAAVHPGTVRAAAIKAVLAVMKISPVELIRLKENYLARLTQLSIRMQRKELLLTRRQRKRKSQFQY